MPRTNHKSVRKNKRVFVRFRDGTTAVDVFVKREKGYIWLLKLGQIKDRLVDSVSIFKGP